jgi:molybdopterin synthase catalytic subunit
MTTMNEINTATTDTDTDDTHIANDSNNIDTHPPHHHPDDTIILTSQPLESYPIQSILSSPHTGGISIFIGTTRDHYEGRYVLSLQYECYRRLAYKQLCDIAWNIRKQYNSTGTGTAIHTSSTSATSNSNTNTNSIQHIILLHRIDTIVPVSESSVICGISSVHRSECISACEYAINTIKASVAIWKKEIYADVCPYGDECQICMEYMQRQRQQHESNGDAKRHECACQHNGINHNGTSSQSDGEIGFHDTQQHSPSSYKWKRNAEYDIQKLTATTSAGNMNIR